MRYGIEIVTLGPLAEPALVVELARSAEEAGFELIAVWDHHAFVWGVPSADPVVTLAAVAQATERVRLLPFVMPLARYHPHVLAHQLAQIDRLSHGRLILGAGLGGVAEEFTAFGQPGDARERAELTDEALAVVSGLWSGDPLEHHGRFFHVAGVTLLPLPVQRPRPPIWIGGESAPALRRAGRWDGWGMTAVDEQGQMTRTPDDIADVVRRLASGGAAVGRGFEVAISGVSAAQPDLPAEYAAAGATWWLESVSPSFGDLDELRSRITAGPAR